MAMPLERVASQPALRAKMETLVSGSTRRDLNLIKLEWFEGTHLSAEIRGHRRGPEARLPEYSSDYE